MSASELQLLDTVTVVVPPEGSRLVRGQVGVVVDLAGELALVEFADADGRTQATAPVPVNGLLLLKFELEQAES